MNFAQVIEPVKLALLGYKDQVFTPSAETLSKRFDTAVKRKQTAIAINTLQKKVLTADDVAHYLLTAARRGDVPLLGALLDTGVDVNGEYSKKRISNPFGTHETVTNALVTTLQHDHEEAANFLLDRGANPLSRTYEMYNGSLTLLENERTEGTSAFQIASKAGFNGVALRIADALLEKIPSPAPGKAKAGMSL